MSEVQQDLIEINADSTQAVAELDSLDAAIDSAIQQVQALADSAGSLTAVDDALASNAGAADALSGSLDSLGSSVDAVQASVDTETAAITKNTEALLANAGAGQAVNDENDGLDLGMQRVGMRLTMIGTVGLAAGAAFIYFGAQAEDSLNKVAALAAGPTDNMAQLTQGVEDIALNLGVSMKQAGDGLYYVISAGFHGKDALNVLSYAMKDALTSGTDLATVADGMTSYMNAMGASAKDASKYSDMMIAAVTAGKMTFGDFAEAIGRASVFGTIFGIKADEVAASIARMTQMGLKAPIAGENLSYLFRSIGNADVVANNAKNMGLAFDETKYKTLSFVDKLKYLKDGIGATEIEFDKFIGGARGTVAAGALLNDGGNAYAAILAQIDKANGKSDAAFKSHETTLKASMEHLGGAFSVFAYQIEQIAKPAVIPLINALTGVFTGLLTAIKQHSGVVVPILAALAVLFGTALVIGIAAFVGAMIVALGAVDTFIAPILAVIAAIAGVVAIVMLVINWLGGWNKIMKELHPLIVMIQHVLAEAGASLKRAFADPAIHQALASLQKQLPSLLPFLQMLGIIIGGVVTAAIAMFIGLLHGVAGALPGLLKALQGLVNVVGGVGRLIMDIIHGKWSDILPAIGQIFGGVAQIIQGDFQAIIGFVGGFVGGVIEFFKSLFDTLVGHSIVPDMMTAIVGLFTGLPGRALGAIKGLATGMATFFVGLSAKGLVWGQDMMSNFVKGIQGMAANVGNAAAAIGGKIKSFLGFTVPETGPLHDADKWMDHFGQLLDQGMQRQTTRVRGAAAQLAQAMSAGAFGGSGTGLSLPGGAGVFASGRGIGTSLGLGGSGDPVSQSLLAQILGALQRGQGAGGAPIVSGGTVSQSSSVTVNGVPGASAAAIARGAIRAQDAVGNRALRRPGGMRRFGNIGSR